MIWPPFGSIQLIEIQAKGAAWEKCKARLLEEARTYKLLGQDEKAAEAMLMYEKAKRLGPDKFFSSENWERSNG